MIDKYGKAVLVFEEYKNEPPAKDYPHFQQMGIELELMFIFIINMTYQTKKDFLSNHKDINQIIVMFYKAERLDVKCIRPIAICLL